MLKIAIIFADSRRDAGNKGQEYLLPFAFNIRKFKAWYNGKKLNTSLYFFTPSASPNLNFLFTLPYSLTFCLFVFFPAFEVS